MDFFKLDLVDFNSNFELEVKGTKDIYNTDITISSGDWLRIDVKGKPTFDAPRLKSALNVKSENNKNGNILINNIGYFFNKTNNVNSNTLNVSLLSSTYSDSHGISIINENFHKVVSLFTARKSITPNWINCKDEYLAPNENHPEYEQFTYDSIVYSLFNNSSQQSSLRQVSYKDKLWDIKNEFFWISKKEIQQLANDSSYDAVYKDARTSDERFVYKQLFESGIYEKLSNDAKEVLDMATDLTKRSFEMRKLVAENNPEYHLDSWDAGYAQLKLVWKDYFKDEFKSFRDKYKSLEDRMRPLVYRLGFLRS